MATAKRREEDKKKEKIRQRFRLLVRNVIVNRNWLSDPGEQKLSLNVKRNIAMLVRPQRKVGLLTIAEKALIRKPHEMRTVAERKKLLTLIAGLSCFSKIPPKLRARLVPHIDFMVLDTGRKLIQAGDTPVNVYFLLYGELEITRKVFDHVTRTYYDKIEAIACPGDTVGDVALFEESKRTMTLVTSTECELLVLFHEEFENILQPFMSKQWFERKRAFKALPYFKYFSEYQIIAACKLSVIRQFDSLETIYYEDKGQLGYVHFVLSGECMILQCLKMKESKKILVTQKKDGKSFELVGISKADGGKTFKKLTNMEKIKIIKAAENQENRPNTIKLDDVVSDEDNDEENEDPMSKPLGSVVSSDTTDFSETQRSIKRGTTSN